MDSNKNRNIQTCIVYFVWRIDGQRKEERVCGCIYFYACVTTQSWLNVTAFVKQHVRESQDNSNLRDSAKKRFQMCFWLVTGAQTHAIYFIYILQLSEPIRHMLYINRKNQLTSHSTEATQVFKHLLEHLITTDHNYLMDGQLLFVHNTYSAAAPGAKK